MTLHAAKGLEFPVVFIVAVEDGVLPHERVGRHPDELEEERRLAFVGITRAKEELQLSYAVTRDFRGVRRRTIPSSFLMEMPREEMELVDEATAYIAQHEQEKHDDLGRARIDGGLDRRRRSSDDAPTAEWQLDDVDGRELRRAASRRSALPPRRSPRPPRSPATTIETSRPLPCPASRPTCSSKA